MADDTNFDFAAYLSAKYPDTTWKIDRLSGGLVNDTVRATRRTGSCGHNSLVLKRVSPYVRIVGPDSPFPQKRQEIEAIMLRSFDGKGGLVDIPHHQDVSITIPKVVGHDSEAYILSIEDLGNVETLWDLFKQCEALPQHLDGSRVSNIFHNLGARVGRFFAALHQPARLQTSGLDGLPLLSEKLSDNLVYDYAVKPIFDRLKDEPGVPDAQELYDGVVADYRDVDGIFTPCLSMGDFHPGSILTGLNLDQLTTRGKVPTLAVIDWEFAQNNGRGINGDIPQFLSELHCYLIDLKGNQSNKSLGDAVKAFMEGMCDAYREDLGQHIVAAERAKLLRSALILEGREMINHAYARFENSTPESRRRMVLTGAGIIRRALNDAGDDLRNDWTRSPEGGNEQPWSLRLFFSTDEFEVEPLKQ